MTNKTILLLGGGYLLLEVAKYLDISKKAKPIIFCSERHFNEILNSKTLSKHLSNHKYEYYKTNAFNVEILKIHKIDYKNSVVFSFGAPWIIRKDVIKLFKTIII